MGSLAEAESPLWTPNPTTLSSLRLEIFRKKINEKYGVHLENYSDLHKWSVQHRASFWSEVWDLGQIIHSEPFYYVVDESISIEKIPKWFTGAKLNFAENLLEKGERDDIAVYYKGEGHPEGVKLTYDQLRSEVATWAAALKNAGVGKNDVVAGILPNSPDTLVALLATASLGGTWTCTSPDYGVTGIVERFKQTEPKVVISVNAVFYNGKIHSMSTKLQQIAAELTSAEKFIIIPFIQEPNNKKEIPYIQFPLWMSSTEFLNEFRSIKTQLNYEQVAFDHPLFIMYSSGTTGKPKCMVHCAGGTLIKHVEEHMLQSDLRKSDVIFYYTTVGWMMYNWLISSLMTGCAIVLYDGAPTRALWDLVDEFGITIFGTSAKWLAVQEESYRKNSQVQTNVEDKKVLDKNHTKLRMMLSTGSPLKPQSYDFIYDHVKKDLLLGSISGGTDIIGCFMGQNPGSPVNRGEIQSFHLGCDLDCINEDGSSVVGERGELIVKSAFPSMPTHFYNDNEGLMYKKAYFAKYKGIWAHGDFMMINPHTKGIVMLGRSDATLNPNGVRFGSAEIYQVVENFLEISDSVCVAQKNSSGTDERVILFLKLLPGSEFTVELVNQVKKSIREELSPRHVPAVILEVKDIPYTISGKKVEIAVRNVIEGEDVKNVGALSNPQCLEFYRNLPQLESFS